VVLVVLTGQPIELAAVVHTNMLLDLQRQRHMSKMVSAYPLLALRAS
jgi:hypothetical protein